MELMIWLLLGVLLVAGVLIWFISDSYSETKAADMIR